jgi:hypothetical protein
MYKELAFVEERLEAIEIDTRKFLFFAVEVEALVSLLALFRLKGGS